MANKIYVDKIEIIDKIKDILQEWYLKKETGILTFEITINQGGVRNFNLIKKHNIL